jgi:iron complex transport system ATP-binding protein
MLEAHNLSLMRGGARVIDRASINLVPGQITAIVGPNGAGKSSLLLAFAGLLASAEGSVRLEGQALTDLEPRERALRIGYLPQIPDIAWDVPVEKLIALGRLPHRDDGATAIDAAIAAVHLEPLRLRPVSQLSGGERARVLLARVLAGEPQWVLADEPLAALDLGHQLTLLAHLRSCAKAGQGVVMVLHDLALAMNHADRIIVLKSGAVIADGAPETALCPEVIAQAWGVATRWLGDSGARALIIQSS